MSSSACVFEISCPQEDKAIPSKSELKVAFDEVKKLPEFPNIKFGDLVYNVEVGGYRNDGLYIYDGEKLLDLDNKKDDYGHLPQKFRVLEKHPTHDFIIPPTYWAGCGGQRGVDHNSIVWFDHTQKRNELLGNITYGKLKCGKYAVYTFCVLDGQKYMIVYNFQGDEDAEYKYNEETFELGDQLKQQLITKFRGYLESDKTICFWCSSWDDTYYVDPDVDQDLDERTIFIWDEYQNDWGYDDEGEDEEEQDEEERDE